MHKDLYNNVVEKLALNVQAIASDTDTAGNIIDTAGYESASICTFLGAVSAGDLTISKIEESDDSAMASATEIPAARLIGSFSTLDTANTITSCGFVSTKRYAQITYTSDNSASFTAGSVITLGNPHNATVR